MFVMVNVVGLKVRLLTLCFLLLLVAAPARSDFVPDDLTPGDYQIVLPERVDANGRAFPRNRHFRHRRSLSQNDTLPESFYVLHAFGREFRFQLHENIDFMSESLVVEHVTARGTYETNVVESVGLHCFQTGSVLGDPSSEAAFSVCHSLLGSFHAFDQHYLIQPLADVGASVFSGNDVSQRKHIMYRTRRPQHFDGGTGNFTSDGENGAQKLDGGNNLYSDVNQLISKFLAQSSQAHSPAKPKTKTKRHKRSMSYERWVEVLVTMDYRMKLYHSESLNQYVLTLFSIVANIYRSPTIGNAINIVVVKLISIEDKMSGPRVQSNAVATLRNFCVWQQQTYSAVFHYDTAVLITRVDICKSTNKCDTLGLAELGTICSPLFSCSINEDNGLSAAFTIAHELGHVLSVPHDDDLKCREYFAKDSAQPALHIMSPTLDYKSNPWSWSTCSSAMLTNFLDSERGDCLLNSPKKVYKLPEKTLPGVNFNVNKQCELVFGNGSKLCPYQGGLMVECRMLVCTSAHGVGCRTQHMPWADGTKCGATSNVTKWCLRGQCVRRSVVRPMIPGGWSSWGAWGACTRSCGGGIQRSKRTCSNPMPRNGGTFCIGERIRYRSCNTDDCENGDDFRDTQCTAFNGQHYNIHGLNASVVWIPKYDKISDEARCRLFCQAAGSSAYYQLRDKVNDGTKCSQETSDICVNGRCWKGGCDNRLSSSAKRDICGICNGDNSTCVTREETNINYVQPHYGYRKVVDIPKGASQIDIRQTSLENLKDDQNYLALKNAKHYILNGDYVVSKYKKRIRALGCTLDYTGSDTVVERINTSKTIMENLTLYILSVGELRPPNISYRFVISVEKPQQSYNWVEGHWKECTKICRGIQSRDVYCSKTGLNNVINDDYYCSNQKKPLTRKDCNMECTVEWDVKSRCSSACGPGIFLYTRRCVRHLTQTGQMADVADEHCSLLPQLLMTHNACHGTDCHPIWKYGTWGECSQRCGQGMRRREVWCEDEHGQKYDKIHCANVPVEQESCIDRPCPVWDQEEWSACMGTCGKGLQTRKVWCNQPGGHIYNLECPRDHRPSDERSCELSACTSLPDIQPERSNVLGKAPPKYSVPQKPIRDLPTRVPARWRTGSWAKCSASCGLGKQARYVSCREEMRNLEVPTEFCKRRAKPKVSRMCRGPPCGKWRTGDWTKCSASCGMGKMTRYVACIVVIIDAQGHRHDTMIADDDCDPGSKPTERMACSSKPRCLPGDASVTVKTKSEWAFGNWGMCSKSCGIGSQRRIVKCYDINHDPSSACPPGEQPISQRVCNLRLCYGTTTKPTTPSPLQHPKWKHGKWSRCTKKCGVRKRIVICQSSNGMTVDNGYCRGVPKPATTRECDSHKCRGTPGFSWQRNEWSRCLGPCSKSVKTRNVTCEDEAGRASNESNCGILKKPPTERPCHRRGLCPRWNPLPWKPCSSLCGEGTRSRELQCVLRHHRVVDPSRCSNLPKPADKLACSQHNCHKFKWQRGKWSECSATCGTGHHERALFCVDGETLKESDPRFCQHLDRPISTQKCNLLSCPLAWLPSPWSECSSPCGIATATRNVSCLSVTKEGWILPGHTTGCNPFEKPPSVNACNLGNCEALFRWKPQPWSECLRECGFGQQHRQVHCVNLTGNKQPRRKCDSSLRPPRRRQCYNRPCYASNCADLRHQSGIKIDGDYRLLIRGRLIHIYCHQMERSSPSEYLSLPHGEKENFAEVFGPRLLNPNLCPFNGARKFPCNCSNFEFPRRGLTTFTKVKIDISSLRVNIHDFTFAKSNGKQIPYGTAGDCYSFANCPQGRFKINLLHTSFSIANTTAWHNYGNKASSRVYVSQDGRVVSGLCGGFCGHCAPMITHGLSLKNYP